MRRRATGAVRCVLFAVVVAYMVGAADAAAQAPPYRPVFGGAAPNHPANDRFDLSVSLAEAYDTSVLAPDGVGAPAGLDVGGYFTALSADVRYAKRGKRADLALNGGTDLRYFQSLGELESVGHYVGAGVFVPVGRRTTIMFNEALSYRPAFLYGLFARTKPPQIGDVLPLASDYSVNNGESYSSVTNLDVRQQMGRRLFIDFSSGYQRTLFAGPDTVAPDVVAYHAGGRLGYPLTRTAILRLGYTYRRAEYASRPFPGQHDVDIGIDYDRALSRSRRTRLAFGAGTSVIQGPIPAVATQESVTQLHAVGHVLLTHQMGRTWSARAAYRRGADFIEEFSAPVFSDAFTVAVDGFVNRRTDVAAAVAYTGGDVVQARTTAFETYTATARLRYGLTRHLAAYGEYLLYYYDSAGAPLTANVPPRVNRHSVRVGLTLWVPLLRN